MNRPIGFSTGAIAKGNYQSALEQLRGLQVRVVELSALRLAELKPLVKAISGLDLSGFEYVSFHAPSRFAAQEELMVVECLNQVAEAGLPMVVHPDVIFDYARWRVFGSLLLIENMDKRKRIGMTAQELEQVFQELLQARLCFDIGHARQVDATMGEARRILQGCGERLAQVHISEVNRESGHDPISDEAAVAFQCVAGLIPERTPIVIESMIDTGQSDVLTEIQQAGRALSG